MASPRTYRRETRGKCRNCLIKPHLLKNTERLHRCSQILFRRSGCSVESHGVIYHYTGIAITCGAFFMSLPFICSQMVSAGMMHNRCTHSGSNSHVVWELETNLNIASPTPEYKSILIVPQIILFPAKIFSTGLSPPVSEHIFLLLLSFLLKSSSDT